MARNPADPPDAYGPPARPMLSKRQMSMLPDAALAVPDRALGLFAA